MRCLQRELLDFPARGIETANRIRLLRRVPDRAIGANRRIVRPRVWRRQVPLVNGNADVACSQKDGCRENQTRCDDASHDQFRLQAEYLWLRWARGCELGDVSDSE